MKTNGFGGDNSYAMAASSQPIMQKYDLLVNTTCIIKHVVWADQRNFHRFIIAKISPFYSAISVTPGAIGQT